MKAMILAAGLGTRMRPLTDNLPKALLPIGKYTLLEFAILKLKHAGFDQIIINVHHFPHLITSYLAEHKNFGCQIEISDESSRLLETGGGIKKAAWFFKDEKAVLIYNVDIVGDLDLQLLYKYHNESNNIATLVLRRRQTTRYLLFNNQMQLRAWQNVATGEQRIALQTSETLQAFAFSGIHMINPALVDFMQQEEAFSIIDTYLKIAGKLNVGGYVDESPLWADAGKPRSLEDASKIAAGMKL
ncbi:MAG: nucleotidyltransferase family protein [Lentimicrobiaceae bacterium]|nr:nucleotidyltransferase family protein [Lentimicrobiaceae bacterium]